MLLSSFSLIIGVLCYVFGLPLVFSDQKYLAWKKKFLKDENSLRLFGVVIIAVAVTTLRRQWQLSPDAEGAIVVIAWLVLAKGLFAAWWPQTFGAVAQRIDNQLLGSTGSQMFTGFVAVLAGALFTYLGLVLA